MYENPLQLALQPPALQRTEDGNKSTGLDNGPAFDCGLIYEDGWRALPNNFFPEHLSRFSRIWPGLLLIYGVLLAQIFLPVYQYI